MKKNNLIIALAGLLLAAFAMLLPDGLTYWAVLLMGFAALGAIGSRHKWVMRYTRWAKANPHKAQGVIALLQLALLGTALISGYNFKQMGYMFSDATAYIFISVMVLGFMTVPFLSKRCTIAIPEEVNRHRFSYLGVILSSFVLVAMLGNRIEDVYPDSLLTRALKAVDRALIPDSGAFETEVENGLLGQSGEFNYHYVWGGSEAAMPVLAAIKEVDKENVEPSTDGFKSLKEQLKAEKKARKFEEKLEKRANRIRKLLAGGSCALAVFLIILMIVPLCAGICLIIGGVSMGAIGAVLLGALITGLTLWGMISAAKWCKNTT